ncbi:HEAT repeat domain-containing protein [Catalinimonas alkaloidigena]|uniref:HEAT repeat domain-containing protein n=1 Tax=Catalinimonas alkaloidigena TaxID=1075417 RepID=UPI0024069224|nr:HEAT repeat domain-containing protein [Catalinimonas alkaloidigena]
MIINKFQKNELKNKEQKQLMTDLLIELKKSFSGNAKRQFQQLYVCLGLQQESIAKLKSRRILQKIKGVRELSEIGCHCPELETAFVDWQNAPQTLLADEVKIAAIRMNSPHMLSFFSQQKSPISEWLQIQLRFQLQTLPSESIPGFSRWLGANEPSAIVFLLQMITLFQQEDALESVLPLLYHTDDEVKAEAINTLEALDAKQYLSNIINLLDANDENLKIKAIHAIGKLGHIFHANLLRPLLRQESPGLKEAAELAIAEILERTPKKSKEPYKHIPHKSEHI